MATSNAFGAAHPPVRLAYLVSHPIQYQAPLLRRIALEPDIDLTVLFGSDFSVRGYKDQGFGVEVQWDVPLLEGYRSEFLPRLRDTGTVSPLSPISRGISRRLRTPDGTPAFEALWVHGYASANSLHGISSQLRRSAYRCCFVPSSGLRPATQPCHAGGQRALLQAASAHDRRNASHWLPQPRLLGALLWTAHAAVLDAVCSRQRVLRGPRKGGQHRSRCAPNCSSPGSSCHPLCLQAAATQTRRSSSPGVLPSVLLGSRPGSLSRHCRRWRRTTTARSPCR